MSPEQRRARSTERLKMTQAEKWLTKQKPRTGVTYGDTPFNEQLRSTRVKNGKI